MSLLLSQWAFETKERGQLHLMITAWLRLLLHVFTNYSGHYLLVTNKCSQRESHLQGLQNGKHTERTFIFNMGYGCIHCASFCWLLESLNYCLCSILTKIKRVIVKLWTTAGILFYRIMKTTTKYKAPNDFTLCQDTKNWVETRFTWAFKKALDIQSRPQKHTFFMHLQKNNC